MTLWKSPYRNLFPSRRRLIEQGFGSLLAPFDFDLGSLTFTAGMAKRAGGAFAAAPIVQGKWDGTGTPDILSYPRGNLIFDNFYTGIDPNQGTISFWVTPEWDGDDGIEHEIYNAEGCVRVFKYTDDELKLFVRDGTPSNVSHGVDISSWTAGTTYHVVCRWDSIRTLDGTNNLCVSINDSHDFGGIVDGITSPPYSNIWIGNRLGNSDSTDSIIEGLRIDRRVWYESTSGTGEPYYFDASGYIDEIAAAYAAGAGADPALVEASWDGCMCLPTDSAVGALATGNGEAWSHPHASALLNNTWLEDGVGPNQQDCVRFNGTTTAIDCGSAAALDDLPTSATGFTAEFWARPDSYGEGGQGRLLDKHNGNDGWIISLLSSANVWVRVACATSNSGLNYTWTPDGKWHHFALTYDDTGARVATTGQHPL